MAADAGAPDAPNFGRVGYVAAGVDEIALVKTKSGLMKIKVTDEVLARAPRSEIQSVELDKGWLSQFDVPKVDQKTAEKLVETLGGQVT
ncbi:MAG: hypothetical protein E6G42_00995 [Actinobacteria bacterium]|nr:MAG: hypothetical protein E6G42_00995 [Actinomycetota bacterium]